MNVFEGLGAKYTAKCFTQQAQRKTAVEAFMDLGQGEKLVGIAFQSINNITVIHTKQL